QLHRPENTTVTDPALVGRGGRQQHHRGGTEQGEQAPRAGPQGPEGHDPSAPLRAWSRNWRNPPICAPDSAVSPATKNGTALTPERQGAIHARSGAGCSDRRAERMKS